MLRRVQWWRTAGASTPHGPWMSLQCRHCSGVRVRFAPSPTGRLHIGGLRTALYNYLFAKSKNGSFILRIEDTDQNRLVPGAAEQIEEMLDWMGMSADESPLKGGAFGPYRQSDRLHLYRQSVSQLISEGKAYRCFCSEKRLDLMRRDAVRSRMPFQYDGRCRHMSQSEIEQRLSNKRPFVVRAKLDDSDVGDTFTDMVFGRVKCAPVKAEGDFVVLKSDGFPTYHLANVVDDHYMKISHVFRGAEWQVSTPKHLVLFRAFGWSPPVYGHLPLILNEDKTKLSKRQNHIHVQYFREQGFYPEAILNLLTLTGGAFQCGQAEAEAQITEPAQLRSMQELIADFDIQHLRTNSSQMDLERLDDFNRVVLQSKLLHSEDSACSVMSQAEEAVKVGLGVSIDDHRILKQRLRWALPRISKVSDLCKPDMVFLWVRPPKLDVCPLSGALLVDIVRIISQCVRTSPLLPEERPFGCRVDKKVLQQQFAELCTLEATAGLKMPSLMRTLRLLLSGQSQGPPLAEMIELLGLDETLWRIQRYLHTEPRDSLP